MNFADTQTAPPSALIWGVKTSFRRYLRTAGGTVTVEPPAIEDGFFFVFPLDERPESEQEGEHIADVRFRGSVHFTAHFGALDFSLREPAVISRLGLNWLTVGRPAAALGEQQRLTIALLTPAPDGQAGRTPSDLAQTELWPVLTAEGSHLFGDVYPTETMLDPLYVPRTLVDTISR